MQADLTIELKKIIQELYGVDLVPILSRPDPQFGDFSTNVAMQLAKQQGKNPREIAEAVAEKLRQADGIAKVDIAGPGFINLALSDTPLLQEMLAILRWQGEYGQTSELEGKTVVAEYSDPNPFKVLHAGHLYTSVVGDAIANLFEAAGATVHRVNFGGDVGRHVAITMWAIIKRLEGENPDKLTDISEDQRAQWLTEAYVEGTNAFEEGDEAVKAKVLEYNKAVYKLHADNDHESPFAQIYWTTRQWSYDYFDQFYARIGTKFEKYYPESETAPYGTEAVKEQLAKGVFEESEGAVVFRGEPYGLHTRVFLNSEGLPTYETKDIGLAIAKWKDYQFDLSVIITGNDIIEYMKVVYKAIEQFMPDIPPRTDHLTHGIVKLQGGVKMSSRKGNILRAVDILDATAETTRKLGGSDNEQIVLGAVKYTFLKQRMGPDIIYNPEESVSIEGNSGPYLQYAHARARSILRKATDPARIRPESAPGHDDEDPEEINVTLNHPQSFEADERTLVVKLSEYPDVVSKAIQEMMPHHVATYLYELAQTFNRFYEKNRVLDDHREPLRLQLVEAYAQILHNGLTLLGIDAPDHM